MRWPVTPIKSCSFCKEPFYKVRLFVSKINLKISICSGCVKKAKSLKDSFKPPKGIA